MCQAVRPAVRGEWRSLEGGWGLCEVGNHRERKMSSNRPETELHSSLTMPLRSRHWFSLMLSNSVPKMTCLLHRSIAACLLSFKWQEIIWRRIQGHVVVCCVSEWWAYFSALSLYMSTSVMMESCCCVDGSGCLFHSESPAWSSSEKAAQSRWSSRKLKFITYTHITYSKLWPLCVSLCWLYSWINNFCLSFDAADKDEIDGLRRHIVT